MAAHRIGQDEAYLTVREVLSKASTATDDVLSRERSVFCRCRYATLGFTQSSEKHSGSFFQNSLCEHLWESQITFYPFLVRPVLGKKEGKISRVDFFALPKSKKTS